MIFKEYENPDMRRDATQFIAKVMTALDQRIRALQMEAGSLIKLKSDIKAEVWAIHNRHNQEREEEENFNR